MRFTGPLELNGKTATGIEVPAGVLVGLGGGRRPPVRVTINGYTYRTSVGSMGGRSLLPVSAEVRERAGVGAGQELAVEIELDQEPRTVEVPSDLAEAPDREPGCRRAFDDLGHSEQRRHVLAVEGAKAVETRRRRIERTVEAVRPAQ